MPTKVEKDAVTGQDTTGRGHLAEVEAPLDGQWNIHLAAISRRQTYRLRERVFLRP